MSKLSRKFAKFRFAKFSFSRNFSPTKLWKCYIKIIFFKPKIIVFAKIFTKIFASIFVFAKIFESIFASIFCFNMGTVVGCLSTGI
jgi:hypothetical protein